MSEGMGTGPFVERLEDGRHVVHDGERQLILPASITPEQLTSEIVAFCPSVREAEPGIMERLGALLWPFGK